MKKLLVKKDAKELKYPFHRPCGTLFFDSIDLVEPSHLILWNPHYIDSNDLSQRVHSNQLNPSSFYVVVPKREVPQRNITQVSRREAQLIELNPLRECSIDWIEHSVWFLWGIFTWGTWFPNFTVNWEWFEYLGFFLFWPGVPMYQTDDQSGLLWEIFVM